MAQGTISPFGERSKCIAGKGIVCNLQSRVMSYWVDKKSFPWEQVVVTDCAGQQSCIGEDISQSMQ